MNVEFFSLLCGRVRKHLGLSILKRSLRMVTKSPLRYPGGKANLAGFLRGLIRENVGAECTYIELYAGGAGAAHDMLLGGNVRRIVLNDADIHIYYF